MDIVRDIEACRDALGWRRSTRRIGMVATMGQLHAGHLAIVNTCRDRSDLSVVCVYVNPLAFRSDDEFLEYPRQLEQDAEQLQALSVDVLFAPRDEELFPLGTAQAMQLVPPPLDDSALDPGYLAAARATVTLKLLNVVTPDQLYVGEKDYYQCVVLQRLLSEFALTTELVSLPIVRELDGVAASAELAKLTPEQRKQAPILHQTIQDLAHAINNGARSYSKLEQTARVALRGGGFDTEYVVVRDAASLQPPTASTQALRILAAARLGMARLTDNLGVTL